MKDLLDKITDLLSIKSPLYLRVKIIPKSSKNEIVDVMEDGTFKIRIRKPATGGKANEELIKFLTKEIRAKEIVIISGHKERVKLIRISA